MDNSDHNGNFNIDFELLTNKSTNNFNIGDIIVTLNNAIAMIVPYYWNKVGLPQK